MTKRERPAMPLQRLVLGEGLLTGDVEAVSAPTVTKEQTAWQVTLPLGTLAPITCIVHAEAIDGAGSLSKLIQTIREGAKDIKIEAIVPTAAGAVGETGYMTALMTYSKQTPGGLLGGQVKMMVRPDDNVSLICFHDEVGYVETFKRVTLGLARSLKAKKPHAVPQFVEIQVAHVGDIPVGFDRRTIENDGPGQKIDETVSCMLLPVSADQLNAEDHIDIERSTAAGRVLAIENVEAEAGEITRVSPIRRQVPVEE